MKTLAVGKEIWGWLMKIDDIVQRVPGKDSYDGYHKFLQSKRVKFESTGININAEKIHQKLFPFQRDLTVWALRKGRAAIFADTGLGKTFMQIEWARLSRKKTIIIAPLSVAKQTVNEAIKIGIDIKYIRGQNDIERADIYITNYEMIDKLDPCYFGAVVLDESSILKGLTGKTRKRLTEMFANTPFRLCCTATPAPNDIAEIANHAEFLGIMQRADMLSTFFVHDDTGWRLRGHAEKAFFRWMASWGMSIKKPSDLGYSDDGFILPKLKVNPLFVSVDYKPEGTLFFMKLGGISERLKIRKNTIERRVMAVADKVNMSTEQWIVWCGLNEESTRLKLSISDSVEVKGGDSLEYKIKALDEFQSGKIRVLVTKPRIAGFGMNFQNCHNMAFVGLSDSWESYYQAIRRCYRFGQKNPVNVHIVLADIEEDVYRNIQKKERQANIMAENLIKNISIFEKEEIGGVHKCFSNNGAQVVRGKNYTLIYGDSVEQIPKIKSESIDFSVFSPPFMDLYSYTPTEKDLGNSKDEKDFFVHFGYIIKELFRITKPGRICAVHVADVPALQVKDGFIGLKDFPGKVIAAFLDKNWIYHGRVTIDKNPQAQAIRTHSKALLFAQMEKDSSWSRPAIGDYILAFRKPGENKVPVRPVENKEITRNEWIKWAHPVWYGIKESDTLQRAKGREVNDDKHICPLQLGTIKRCITLWSNPGDVVLSPFAGIMSEIYQAVKMGRRGIGIELKQSYFEAGVENMRLLEEKQAQEMLF